jgi:hypothetical protein
MLASLSVGVLASASNAAARDDEAPRASPPPNVMIDEVFRDPVHESLARSATLQRQFAVIAGAMAIVEVRLSKGPLSDAHRAEAIIKRYDSGHIRARILLPAGADFVQLLAHELEHVVEQIEGVDLAALARTGDATRGSDGFFETARARDAGRTAASEVEQATRALNAHD